MALRTKGKLISILINNEFIKICEVTKSGRTITIHREVTMETPTESYFDGTILDMEGLSKAMRIALDDNRITTENAVFSITSTKIATKEVIIPNIKLNKIEGLVQANANEYFPVNIDEYIIQHSVLEKVEEEGVTKLKILVMAAPSRMIDEYYQLASKLNLKVEAIDYIGNSTSSALRHQIGNETSAVIQVENDSTIVNIFENNVLQLQRTIPYGKSIVVNEVMAAEKMDYDSAFEKMQNEVILHGTFDGDPLTENLQYLVSNINRVMDYYVSRNTSKVIEKAYILGGATTMKNFVELMTNELHVNLINITTFKDVVLDKKGYIDERVVASYISNIGALLSPVNFVPKTMVDEEKKKDTTKFYVLAMVGAVIIAAALVAIPMVGMLSAKSTKDTLQAEVDGMKDIEAVVNSYYQAKDKADDAAAFSVLTINNNDAIEEFIGILEDGMPSDVAITSMSISSGAVTLSGTASSKSSVAKLIQILNEETSVSNPYVASETESRDSAGTIMVTFSMTCNFTVQEAN